MLAKNQVEECLMSSLLILMVIDIMCSFNDIRLDIYQVLSNLFIQQILPEMLFR